MPSVRAKAIANLACVMERGELLHAVRTRGGRGRHGVDIVAQLLQHMQEEQGAGDLSTMSRDLNQTSEQEVKLQLDSLMDIMKRRSEDSKSFVRKSSVQVLLPPLPSTSPPLPPHISSKPMDSAGAGGVVEAQDRGWRGRKLSAA